MLPFRLVFTNSVAAEAVLRSYFLESNPSLTFCDADAADAETPLKPSELQVLRAQYEKEGEYVGIQTKFNYAWVRLHHDSWYFVARLSVNFE